MIARTFVKRKTLKNTIENNVVSNYKCPAVRTLPM